MTVTPQAPPPQLTFLEPEPELPPVLLDEPAPPEPVHVEAPPQVNGHEPLFDDLDVPAILRRRMVQ